MHVTDFFLGVQVQHESDFLSIRNNICYISLTHPPTPYRFNETPVPYLPYLQAEAVMKKLKEFKIIKRKIKNKKSAHPRRFPFFILPFDYFEFFQFVDPHPFES
jgi:hypothetical protein